MSQVGTSTDAFNFNVGSLTLVVDTQGVGTPNYYLNDGDNLTKAIKTLDQQVGNLIASVTEKSYDEEITIVSGSPTTNQLVGPVVVSTPITIPTNSRNLNIQQTYIVGAGTLEVYLNGQKLFLNSDYTEVGTAGTASSTITNLSQWEETDVIFFNLDGKGLGGVGSTAYTASNLGSGAQVFSQIAGTEIQHRTLTAGANITLVQNTNDIVISATAGGVVAASGSIYNSNHSLIITNDIALGDTSLFSITLTLPDATTCPGKIFYIKKIALLNTLYIKSVLSQALDGIDVDVTPYGMTIQFDSVTLTSVAGNWYFI
jgi:hypothetical protein